MALRLRRGTDAERLLITPVQGELIYTTDTKKLYIGDGTTVGGRLVEGAGSPDLAGLDDINVAGAINGQVLAYDTATLKWIPSTPATSGTGDGVVEGSNYQINIIGYDSSIMVDTDALQVTANLNGDSFGTHIGPVVGDVKGSVFGDDSNILVDGINGKIVGVVENAYTSAVEYVQGANVRIGSAVAGGNYIVLQDNVDSSLLVLTTEDPAGQVISVRPLQVGSTVGPDGTINIVTSTAYALGMTIVGSFDGAENTLSAIHRSRGTKTAPTAIQNGDGLGSFILTGYNGAGYTIAGGIKATVSGTPQAAHIPANVELYVGNAGGAADVVLRAKYDQKVTELLGPLKLVPFTTAERNALTPEEGMVIFNTDTTIAQVYANSAWRDMNVAA